ncbi:SH3 domain-containing protein [bacterium]|nr:SH3 domain-containing protein [bacterium]
MKRFFAGLLACTVLLSCGCTKQPEPVYAPLEITPAPETVQLPPTESTPPSDAPRLEPPPAMNVCVVECEGTVNLRSGASSHAELLEMLPAGSRVRVIEFEERYAYVEVLENGWTGYMIAGYLRPEEDVLGLDIVTVTDSYTYEQMRADMLAFKEKYGDAVTLETAGETVCGVEIPVLVLGARSAPHHVFVQAAIHAREHMTALLAMALSEAWLSAGASEDVCFHVMPMANPDGVKISQEAVYDDHTRAMYANDFAAGQTQEEGEEYLHKWKSNYNGVDINRNFDALWDKVNSAPAPSAEGYRGSAPGSEPETQALISYTQAYDFDATISYHATGSMIYWQFGPATEADKAAHALAEVIGELAGYSVEFDDGTSFGGYKDWASSKCGIPSLTIEIGTRSAPLPETDFYNIWVRNRFVFKAVAEWVKSA